MAVTRPVRFIDRADFKAKIVIAGSQDYLLDPYFATAFGATDEPPEADHLCLESFQHVPSVTYLYHETKTVQFEHTDGHQVRFTIFGSPYSKEKEYVTAFRYKSAKATALWSDIPLNTDIVVTHVPPKYHCDDSSSDGAARCSALREALWRIRPRLAVCGHEHQGRGAEVVIWDLDTPHVRFKETHVHHQVSAAHLILPNVPVVDLTKRGPRVLCNDGAVGNLVPELGSSPKRGWEVTSKDIADDENDNEPVTPELQHAVVDRAWALPHWHTERHNFSPPSAQHPAFYGLGGSRYGVSDQEAISGREGRKETCIVNGAYMSVRQPSARAGSIRNSQPVVVDIDFPVVVPGDEYYVREAQRNVTMEHE